MALTSGSRLGPYEVLTPIGAGGMGEVYKANDTRLDRTVAIKVLPEHLAESPERKARFEREAKAISQVNHPHICTLFDVGEQDGLDYLVMEYIEGETLAERLKRGALKLDQALEYGIQIADGLDKAHRAAIVHRDLKPGNMMLTKSGVKLLDFGLARLLEDDDNTDTSDAPTRQKDLTAEESIIGTLQYMAPEQLERKPADTRTDIFALGVVLYEMLTGKKAFAGSTQASLISAIMSSEPPPISELQSMSPALLDRIVRRCLEKDPDERWQSVKDLATELSWVRDGDPQLHPPSPSREKWAWGVAAVATMALLALATTSFDHAPTDVRVTELAINAPAGASFAHWGLKLPAVSPDGRHIAVIVRDGDEHRIWVRSLDSLESRPLEGTESPKGMFWSPDSRSIAFHAEGALKRVDLAGGPPQTLARHGAESWGGAWNDDGVLLYAPIWSSIHRVRSGGQASDPLTRLDVSHGELAHWLPQFLPDGEHFIFHVESQQAEHEGMYVASLESPEDKRLVLRGVSATFAAPGYLLFIQDGSLLAQRFDVDRLEIVGEPVAMGKEVAAWYGHALLSVSTNGILAYRRPYAPDYQLAWFDRRGSALGVLPLPCGAQNAEFSPDGTQIAFECWDSKIGTRDVWLFELSRRVASRFTFDPANDSDPVWAPEGDSIIFSSGRNGHHSLYRKAAAGSSDVELIHEAIDEEWPMSWSPDGKHLLFERWSSQSSADSVILPLTGSHEPSPMLNSGFEENQFQFSPDGNWTSYTSNESGHYEVYVQPFPLTGAKLQISTEGGSDGRWRADGNEMFYVAADDTLMAVALSSNGKTLVPSTPEALFTVPATGLPRGEGLRFLYDVSNDGERFVMFQVSPSSPDEMIVVQNWMAALEQ